MVELLLEDDVSLADALESALDFPHDHVNLKRPQ
jgi:hypothetical protein